jgi:succinoglycan biosynthesis protein ExoO
MLPHRLELLVKRASSDRAAIVADNFLTFSGDENRARPHLRTRTPRWIGLSEFVHSTCLYSLAPDLGYLKPLISMDTIHALRARYDERLRLGEDFNFLAKLLVKGARLRVDPAPMHLYRRHANSLSKRMTIADLRASLTADQEWASENAVSGAEKRALRRRRHSLEAVVTYERVMQSLKGRETARALTQALSNPRTWYYLSRALAKRVSHTLSRQTQWKGGTAPSELPAAAARVSGRDDLFA